MIFLDASALIAAEDLSDPEQQFAVALVNSEPQRTLDLAFYEITNVCDFRWSDPAAAARLRATVAQIDEAGLLVRTDSELMSRAGEIARERSISAYDAAYVAASERTGLPLVSCDIHDLVSKGLAVTPSAMLERLRDEADASADGDDADA